MGEEFEKICRACNSEKVNLLNLFVNDCEDEPTLGEKLNACTSLKVFKDDNMPQNICYPCTKILESFYKFFKMCHETNFDLLKKVSQIDFIEKTEDDNDLDVNFEDTTSQSPTHSNNAEVEEVILCADQSEKEDYAEEVLMENFESAPEPADLSSSDNDRQVCCNDCNKMFFTSRALELHNKLYHKKPSNVKIKSKKLLDRQSSLAGCDECDMVFGDQNDYRDHMRDHHKGKSPENICTVCGRKLRNKLSLKTHMKVHDNENRIYPCNVCGKKYSHYKYLDRHMLYHKETVFKCFDENCSRSYPVKHKLVDHLRRHHHIEISQLEVRQIQPDVQSN